MQAVSQLIYSRDPLREPLKSLEAAFRILLSINYSFYSAL